MAGEQVFHGHGDAEEFISGWLAAWDDFWLEIDVWLGHLWRFRDGLLSGLQRFYSS